MILQYKFEVNSEPDIPSSRAYAYYSSLLSTLPEDMGNWLHTQGETLLSQFIFRDNSTGKKYWQVSLLGEAAVREISPYIDGLSRLDTALGIVPLTPIKRESITTGELLTQGSHDPERRRTTFRLLSPTAFKQNNKYYILPDARLVCQSLINKWNCAFPSLPIEDEDAKAMLYANLRVEDLNLRSTRFLLKNTKIPGVVGSVTIGASLPAPMMEIWDILTRFSVYSGVGIKTTLGMGGVETT